jgi:hypothetical protein
MTNDFESIMKHTLAFFLALLAAVSASANNPNQKPNVVVTESLQRGANTLAMSVNRTGPLPQCKTVRVEKVELHLK